MRNELMKDPFVQEAVDLFDQITLALVGIGSIEPSKLLASSGNVFTAEELSCASNSGQWGIFACAFSTGRAGLSSPH